MERLVKQLVDRARSVVDAGRSTPVSPEDVEPLHAPHLLGNSLRNVEECVETAWVSSAGRFVERFEEQLSELTAVHAVAVVNGTCALETALRTVGVRPGDLVACPALGFVAVANAIVHAGARPLFVDVERERLGLCPQSLSDALSQTWGARVSAVVAVSVFGHPFDVEGISAVCEQARIPLVEDAAEALGSRHGGRHMGTFGRLGILSFNGNKLVTTGGGGAILTDDPQLAREIKHKTTTAKVPHAWEYHHDEIGYNYRLPNLNAALGCAQLEYLPELLASKRRLARRYRDALNDVDGVAVLWEPARATSNFWLNTIVLGAPGRSERDQQSAMALRHHALEALNAAGLQSRPVWWPLHLQKPFAACPHTTLDVAEDLGRRVINLPSSAPLGRALSEA